MKKQTVSFIKKRKIIGQNLRQLRGELSQKAFAKKIDVPYRSYQRYELGERVPAIDVLLKIAERCYITLDWLFTGKEKYKDIKKAKLHQAVKEQHLVEDLISLTRESIALKEEEKLQKKSSLILMFEQIERIYNEGNKIKINAVKSQLDALDPGKKTTQKRKSI
jgi:transcriptional regulator with XRE-family HTH domain